MTMAKGSGGVGKKSGSVSGAKAAVKATAGGLMSAPMSEFVSSVYGAWDKIQINNGAPISKVFEALPKKGNMTLDQFKKRLHEGFMDDKISLGRNELETGRYTTQTLRDSLLNDRGREYVFIRKLY